MLFGDDFLTDLEKQMESDFAYDVINDTNFSGAFPENGEADYPNNDSFLSDDEDEDDLFSDDFGFDDDGDDY